MFVTLSNICVSFFFVFVKYFRIFQVYFYVFEMIVNWIMYNNNLSVLIFFPVGYLSWLLVFC